jgi:hypothetical protein
MFRSTKITAVVVALALIIVPFRWTVEANHSWGGYHWARTQNPFTVQLGDNLTSTWDAYLSTASSEWSKSVVMNTIVVAGQARSRNCRPTAGRVEVCNDTYGNNGWLGVAQIWLSGKHITQGTVKLNDTYFNTSKYNAPAWRNLVACQEIGHTFGLDHQDETFDNKNLGTCMDYTNDPTTNQYPNQHDYEELEIIYSHLDSTTTTYTSPAAANMDLDHPSTWGQLMRSGGAGRYQAFLRDLGNGQQVVTFVIWA